MHQLSVLLDYDYPETAIPVIKKLNSLDPSLGNDRLGIAYERLGDYKTAWIYFKKELKVGQDNPQRKYGSRLHVDALEVGEPIIPPIENTSVDSASMSIDELERFIAWSKAILKNSPDEGNAFLKKELKAHLQGHKTSFEPVRIVRAYELIERYGEDEGIERLKKRPRISRKSFANNNGKGVKTVKKTITSLIITLICLLCIVQISNSAEIYVIGNHTRFPQYGLTAPVEIKVFNRPTYGQIRVWQESSSNMIGYCTNYPVTVKIRSADLALFHGENFSNEWDYYTLAY